MEVGNKTTIVHNKEIGNDLLRDEKSWIQVQTNLRKMMEDKLYDHSALSLRKSNRFESLTNLNENQSHQ
jgi:hypothetical protein